MAGTVINIILISQILVIINSANDPAMMRGSALIGKEPLVVGTRIVGGTPANIKDYPYVVSVQWRLGSKHECGGTYILPRFVLSAAHCMVRFTTNNDWQKESPRMFLILAGSTNLWYSPTWQISVTDAVIPHPAFDFDTMANDIGLFRTAKAFRITPYVAFAPLSSDPDDYAFDKKNRTCTIVGWGKTSEWNYGASDVLRHATLPIITREECGRYFYQDLHVSQICAGKKEGGVDSCQGDSGGPLICNGLQLGIVSWGLGCAARNSPGVYCRVDRYSSWIRGSVQRNSPASTVELHFSLAPLVYLVILFYYMY